MGRNNNYLRGVAVERMLVNEARDKGLLAARSAGSHSAIDVWIWDMGNRTLRMIQCKRHKKKQNPGLSNPFVQTSSIQNCTVISEVRHFYDKRITKVKKRSK